MRKSLDDCQITVEKIGLPEKGEFYPSVEYMGTAVTSGCTVAVSIYLGGIRL